jgi:hypothetical protein
MSLVPSHKYSWPVVQSMYAYAELMMVEVPFTFTDSLSIDYYSEYAILIEWKTKSIPLKSTVSRCVRRR